MAKGGAIKKLILDGLEWELSSDNDANVTIGGEYVTEIQETTGKPFALIDKISGNAKGLELRTGLADGSMQNFNNMAEKSAQSGVSAKIIFADGGSFTASGGAYVVVSGAGDGMTTTRENKTTIDIHPLNGKWIPAAA